MDLSYLTQFVESLLYYGGAVVVGCLLGVGYSAIVVWEYERWYLVTVVAPGIGKRYEIHDTAALQDATVVLTLNVLPALCILVPFSYLALSWPAYLFSAYANFAVSNVLFALMLNAVKPSKLWMVVCALSTTLTYVGVAAGPAFFAAAMDLVRS